MHTQMDRLKNEMPLSHPPPPGSNDLGHIATYVAREVQTFHTGVRQAQWLTLLPLTSAALV